MDFVCIILFNSCAGLRLLLQYVFVDTVYKQSTTKHDNHRHEYALYEML